MIKRAPKTVTATIRELNSDLEAVKGGVIFIPMKPRRIPLDPNTDGEEDPSGRPGDGK